MSTKDHEFIGVLENHSRFIGNALHTYERDPSIREELYQEVSLAIWRALDSFRGEASIKTFIARITHNIGVSHIRRVTRRPIATELHERVPSQTPSPERAVEALSAKQSLMQAINTLPINLRQVVGLYLEDFSHAEIAETLGISSGNVAVRLTRARSELSKIMESNK